MRQRMHSFNSRTLDHGLVFIAYKSTGANVKPSRLISRDLLSNLYRLTLIRSKTLSAPSIG
jgi:hypothetical protein